MQNISDIRNNNNTRVLFENLIRPHLDSLYRLAYRFTGTTTDAEDLLQDLLVKIYPKVTELAEIDKLHPWLARVLYRMFIDNKRRYARSPIRLVSDDNIIQDYDTTMDNIASHAPMPDEETESKIRNRQLKHAITCLNTDQRILLSFHDMEGYTLNELQAILDCPIGTLKSRLHRARARLRELLEQGTL